MERVNQELEQYLHAFCNYKQTNWPELLPYAEFAHNIREHSAMHQPPFQLMYGYNPSFAPKIEVRLDIPNIEQRLEALDRMRKETKASLEVVAELMKRRTAENKVKLEEGQKVWLSGKNITMTHSKDKLAPKLYGPFVIEKKIGPVTFKLKLPPTWKIHPMFHASLITPYKETFAHGPNFKQPPPDLIEGKEEYEVEEILNKRKQGHGFQYLVK